MALCVAELVIAGLASRGALGEGIQIRPRAASAPPAFLFADVAEQAGLTRFHNVGGGVEEKKYLTEETGSGVAFLDFNNDGRLDVFFVNGSRHGELPPGEHPTNRLFRNNGDGTFTDVTETAGVGRSGWGQGCCVADLDNDGDEDLFVTYWGQNVLYRNNGDGTFTDITDAAGLKTAGQRWATGCTFLDYDKDGLADLFHTEYVVYDPRTAPQPGENNYCRYFGLPVACGPEGLGGGTNRLYRNRGDGTFENVTEKSGVAHPRGPLTPTSVADNWQPIGMYGMGVASADFDNDGWPDIYVACDTAPSRLYRNNRNGTFTEMGVMAGCALSEDGVAQAGMGVGVGDYNNDGWLDLVKTNFSDQTVNLYRNNGDGTFHDAVFQAGLGINTKYLGWGAGFVDLDNDGWQDVLLANGHVYPSISRQKLHVTFKQSKVVYRNLGNGRFADVTARAGPGAMEPRASRGCAFGDFDVDGDVDVAVNNMNDVPSLLRNDGGGKGNWLLVKCIGTQSNRSGIGARIRVVTGSHTQIGEVMSGGSYASQNDLRVHFGLGEAARVDLLEVLWPSGRKDTVSNVAANQFVVVREGEGATKSEKFGARR